jgi:hypothetical protein
MHLTELLSDQREDAAEDGPPDDRRLLVDAVESLLEILTADERYKVMKDYCYLCGEPETCYCKPCYDE